MSFLHSSWVVRLTGGSPRRSAVDSVNLAQSLVNVTDGDEGNPVVNKEGEGCECGSLLSTVLSTGRAEGTKGQHSDITKWYAARHT